VFVWSYGAASVVLWAPLGLGALVMGSGRVGTAACALMAVSGALHGAYFVMLQRGYRTGDLSQVYPLARGTGPLLAVPLAAIALGQDPSALDLAGGAVIVGAVLSLAGWPSTGARRGWLRVGHRHAHRRLHRLGRIRSEQLGSVGRDLLLGLRAVAHAVARARPAAATGRGVGGVA
jgi:uncharacterized membrane protein